MVLFFTNTFDNFFLDESFFYYSVVNKSITYFFIPSNQVENCWKLAQGWNVQVESYPIILKLVGTVRKLLQGKPNISLIYWEICTIEIQIVKFLDLQKKCKNKLEFNWAKNKSSIVRVGPKHFFNITFLGPKFFWTKNFFGPTFFWTKNFFLSKFFLTQISFDPNFLCFGSKNFWNTLNP